VGIQCEALRHHVWSEQWVSTPTRVAPSADWPLTVYDAWSSVGDRAQRSVLLDRRRAAIFSCQTVPTATATAPTASSTARIATDTRLFETGEAVRAPLACRNIVAPTQGMETKIRICFNTCVARFSS